MTQNYHVVVAFRSTDRAPGRSYSHPPCADVPGRTSVPNRWNQGDMCILQFGMWRVFWYLWLPKKHIKNIVISTSNLFLVYLFGGYVFYMYTYIRYTIYRNLSKTGDQTFTCAWAIHNIWSPGEAPELSCILWVAWNRNESGIFGVVVPLLPWTSSRSRRCFFSIGDAWKCETNKLDFFLGDEIKDNKQQSFPYKLQLIFFHWSTL